MSTFSLQGATELMAQQDRGTRVVLRDAYGETLTIKEVIDGVETDVECWALVAGQLSATYRKAEDALRDRQLKRRTAMQLNSETLVKQQMELTAACVLNWNLRDGARVIPCTRENIVTVFIAAPWIRTEIEAAMADPARFLE